MNGDDPSFRLKIDPEVGNVLLHHISEENDVPVHIILIAFPEVGGGTGVGTPTFVTSLHPDSMRQVLMALRDDYMPKVGDPTTIRKSDE